jgi:NAD(P)-dependent dehydrogenase (short-subunit alcohol dehydrogenase family)
MSTAIDCDVALAGSVRAAFDRIDREAPRLDILVNNAGIAHIGTVENTGEGDLDRVYAVQSRDCLFARRRGCHG